MGILRLIVRGPLLLLWTALIYLSLMGGSFLWFPWPRLRRRWRNAVFHSWAVVSLRLLGVELEVVGRAPERPFFIVSNHLSYIDILVLGQVLTPVFVAKSEIAGWPGFGLISKGAGTIFVDRASRRDILRVNEEIRRALDAGHGLVLFAEGTSTAGDRVAPFRASLLHYPASTEMPVHPAILTYRTVGGLPPAYLAVCWWGGMPLVPHLVRLLTLPGFEARLEIGAEPVVEGDRKELARRLQQEVAGRFDPVVDNLEEPCLAIPS